MKTGEKGPSRNEKNAPVPRAARFINTAIAVVLLGLSAYHYTQPDQAWRSGTIELGSAALLIAAVYWLAGVRAMVVNLVIAVAMSVLGVRHLIHGGGWRSGTVELLFVVLLVAAAVIIYRSRRK
jgi:hypothetical protein